MCRPREGDDRGRWLLFLPAEPLELVARPYLRWPAALRVRRPSFPPEGRPALARQARRLALQGVGPTPGRPQPPPLALTKEPRERRAAAVGEVVRPPDRRPTR